VVDLSETIMANSNQLNADDLIGRELTIEITDVSGGGTKEQPITIHYTNEDGKPWKPCKTMRRILVGAWGNDGKSYIGRKITLYRDPEVQYGGQKVGGIRISHLSHIDKPLTMSLTATSKSKKPITVKPIAETAPKKSPQEAKPAVDISATLDMHKQALEAAANIGIAELKSAWDKIPKDLQPQLEEHKEKFKKIAKDAEAPATDSAPTSTPDIP
jgi:hypothetical protein